MTDTTTTPAASGQALLDAKPNSSHTRGPWVIRVAKDGTLKIEDTHIAGYSRTIANVVGKLPVDYANATLIENAPRLLAALSAAERFVSGFEGDEIQEGITELLLDMRATIAEAKGLA